MSTGATLLIFRKGFVSEVFSTQESFDWEEAEDAKKWGWKSEDWSVDKKKDRIPATLAGFMSFARSWVSLEWQGTSAWLPAVVTSQPPPDQFRTL